MAQKLCSDLIQLKCARARKTHPTPTFSACQNRSVRSHNKNQIMMVPNSSLHMQQQYRSLAIHGLDLGAAGSYVAGMLSTLPFCNWLCCLL